MIGVIILIDQMVWRPVIAWARSLSSSRSGQPRSRVRRFDSAARFETPSVPDTSLVVAGSRKVKSALREGASQDIRRCTKDTTGYHTGLSARWRSWCWGDHLRGGQNASQSSQLISSAELRHIVWGAGRYLLAGRSCSAARGSLDDSRRSSDRVAAQAVCRRAADCTDCRIGAGDSAVPDHSSRVDSRRRRSRESARLCCCSWARSGTSCST